MSSPSRWRWFLSWSSMRMEAQVWIGLATCCAAVLWIQNGNWWVLSSWWEKWLTSEEYGFTSRKRRATLQLVQEALCTVLQCRCQEGLCIGPDGKGSGSLSGTFVSPWQWERLGRGAAYHSSLVTRSSVPRLLPSQRSSCLSATCVPRWVPFLLVFLSFVFARQAQSTEPLRRDAVRPLAPWLLSRGRRHLSLTSLSHTNFGIALITCDLPLPQLASSHQTVSHSNWSQLHATKLLHSLPPLFKLQWLLQIIYFWHVTSHSPFFHTTSDAHGAVVSYCIGTTTTQSVACSIWATKIFLTILLTCQNLKKCHHWQHSRAEAGEWWATQS
jgi:hypothetical protein